MNKKIILVLLILVVCCSVEANLFNKGNATQIINGHQVKLISITEDEKCLFSVDGDRVVVGLYETKKMNEIMIWVKEAFASNSKDSGSDFCEAIVIPEKKEVVGRWGEITTIEPGEAVKDEPPAEKEEKAKEEAKEELISTDENNTITNNTIITEKETDKTIAKVPEKQGIFQRIISWLKRLL